MKLRFVKNEKSQINVVQVIGKEEKEFSYVDMIKSLIEAKKLEKPEVLGEFTEAEIKSINSMTDWINKTVAAAAEAESTSENSEN